MQTIQSSEGQILLDVAIEYCGDASLVTQIAILNGLDIDDILLGQSLIVPEMNIDKKAIVDSLKKYYIVPASALSQFDNYEDEWQQYYSTGLPSSHA